MESAYNKIIKTRDKVKVSRIFLAKHQKGENKLTAELKQTVHSSVTYPPEKSVAKRKSDNPLSTDLVKPKTFTRSKTYVAFLNVDEEISIEDAQLVIDNHPNATVYKILSNFPILTDIQKLSLESTEDKIERQQFYDLIANRQLIVKNGNLITDSYGKPQYLATFYSNEFVDDEDLRTSDDKYYTNKLVETYLNLKQLNKRTI